MFDLIRKGLKISENLSRFPVRLFKQVSGNRKSRLNEAANITEDLIGVSFQAARKVLDRAEGKEIKCEACGGPTVKNILVKPEVTILSDDITDSGNSMRRVEIKVTGLLCEA